MPRGQRTKKAPIAESCDTDEEMEPSESGGVFDAAYVNLDEPIGYRPRSTMYDYNRVCHYGRISVEGQDITNYAGLQCSSSVTRVIE